MLTAPAGPDGRAADVRTLDALACTPPLMSPLAHKWHEQPRQRPANQGSEEEAGPAPKDSGTVGDRIDPANSGRCRTYTVRARPLVGLFNVGADSTATEYSDERANATGWLR